MSVSTTSDRRSPEDLGTICSSPPELPRRPASAVAPIDAFQPAWPSEHSHASTLERPKRCS
eukprot:7195901-Pyramimonas_sp.AAC.1